MSRKKKHGCLDYILLIFAYISAFILTAGIAITTGIAIFSIVIAVALCGIALYLIFLLAKFIFPKLRILFPMLSQSLRRRFNKNMSEINFVEPTTDELPYPNVSTQQDIHTDASLELPIITINENTRQDTDYNANDNRDSTKTHLKDEIKSSKKTGKKRFVNPTLKRSVNQEKTLTDAEKRKREEQEALIYAAMCEKYAREQEYMEKLGIDPDDYKSTENNGEDLKLK